MAATCSNQLGPTRVSIRGSHVFSPNLPTSHSTICEKLRSEWIIYSVTNLSCWQPVDVIQIDSKKKEDLQVDFPSDNLSEQVHDICLSQDKRHDVHTYDHDNWLPRCCIRSNEKTRITKKISTRHLESCQQQNGSNCHNTNRTWLG